MKLAELPREGGSRGTHLQVKRLLEGAGLAELAAFSEWASAPDHENFYVATDAGLYVGDYARRATPGLQTLEGTLTPWSDVRGARLVLAGFQDSNEGSIATLTVASPVLELIGRPSLVDQHRALVELAIVCLKRQGRTPEGEPETGEAVRRNIVQTDGPDTLSPEAHAQMAREMGVEPSPPNRETRRG